MTTEDTQAVARKQAELNIGASPALAVDGMAGPRTLPTVFKIGLAQDVPLAAYTTKSSGGPVSSDDRQKQLRFCHLGGPLDRTVPGGLLPRLTDGRDAGRRAGCVWGRATGQDEAERDHAGGTGVGAVCGAR
jgi:hypothetical protein